ncbi:hypothetical protein ACFXGA_12630 [Actinosynnema sp. NPDC059335]|uniref:hypothetical protein n=1 Tax=Actinosynnema sp. NPDC059335 TaxID=3346804 RepID=UPI00366E4561
MTYVVRSGPTFRDGSHGLWTGESSGFRYSMSCEAADRGFLAPAIADRGAPVGADAREDPEHYFDPDRPMPTADSCHR